MPLPTTGPISINDLKTEFGDSNGNPSSLNEYLRGGANVPAFTVAGTGSFSIPPAATASNVQIPTSTSTPLQLSMYYGTEATIFGSTGIVTAPSSVNNYFQDFTLPAGVRYVRFLLVGGGGGSGGSNTRIGGQGGGGSVMYGTIDTNAFGNYLNTRTLKVFVGKGGAGGAIAGGNSILTPSLGTVDHGPFMVPRTFGEWGTWMNLYAVNENRVLGGGPASYAGTRSFVRYIYCPVSGIYTFQAQADDTVTINVNGTDILTSSGTYANISPSSQTLGIVAGYQRVTITYSNFNVGPVNPGGFAVRILDPSSNEVWTTRYDAFAPPGFNGGFPAGGLGGYAGVSGASGYGGGGGSATWFAIVDGSNFYPVALAAGGGGGGGAGESGYDYINGNVRTQHFTRISASLARFIGGGEGETIDQTNNGESIYLPANTSTTGWPPITDGGGGGGGGGGLYNERVYAVGPGYQFMHSGHGGKRPHFYPLLNQDGDAEGGESGRSWINPSATTYADFIHRVTTGRTPNFPSTLPGGAAGITSYGIGADRFLTSNTTGLAGANGAAFFDWGYTDNDAPAVSAPASALQASVYPIAIFLTALGTQDTTFIADAWGGGGFPSESGYTYSWQYHSGNAISFSSPSSARTNVTTEVADFANPKSGTIRCVVSDGVSSATAYINWSLTIEPPPDPGGGG